jgi:sugar/nucleoside kinase (ribokinase family)
MVGVVGQDFPKKCISLYRKHRINLDGLQILPGKTFHWSGEYEVNMNNRRTLLTELGVFETFTPHLPATHKTAQFVLLANIAPALQHHVLDQMQRPKFVVADTMDLWLNIALNDLIKLVARVHCFVLNDSEAHQLTKEDNVFTALKKIHRLGPKYVIIKKGSHGSILSSPKGFFICPAYPLHRVIDPTGAGDSFVGGMMGYLATAQGPVDAHIRRAMIHGSVTASFCCEGFGLNRTTKIKRADINQRVKELEMLTRF